MEILNQIVKKLEGPLIDTLISKFHGPIMVQQFFLSALKLLMGATRVA